MASGQVGGKKAGETGTWEGGCTSNRAIGGRPGLAVHGAVATRVAALEAMRESQPDLVIVDLALGDEDGLDLVKEIRTRYPKVPSLVLSMHDEAVYAERALTAGARGYVTKQQLDDTVLGAIRRALAGETYMSEALQRRLAEQYVGGQTLNTGSPMRSSLIALKHIAPVRPTQPMMAAMSLTGPGPRAGIPRKRSSARQSPDRPVAQPKRRPHKGGARFNNNRPHQFDRRRFCRPGSE